MTYEKQIWDPSNKIRTTWNIIHREVRKKVSKDNIQTLCIEGKNTTDLNTLWINFKTFKFIKSSQKHYMFRPIWPSSGVKISGGKLLLLYVSL
jgi:hypothetical protein